MKFNYSFRSFGGCEEGAFFSLTPTVEIRERMRMHERAVEQIIKSRHRFMHSFLAFPNQNIFEVFFILLSVGSFFNSLHC